MSTATISLTTAGEMAIAPIDRGLFGGFAEHLGRCVYEGIFDPGSPLADAAGYRTDVIAAMRRMGVSMVRYPGGNFVSCYDWRDGVGPREQRPARPDFAWRSLETNAFGVDEFLPWCQRVGAEPIMAVNLGTLGLTEAAQLLEYCNLDTPTHWAQQRRRNGRAEPYGIKYWCLGNEMDGPWQAGHVPARDYALRAAAASRMLKGLDPTIKTIAAGSSGRGMVTYMAWDREVLEQCWDTVDFISAHRYSGNGNQNSREFLAEGMEIDRILNDYAGLLAYVRGLKRSNKRVFLSFDEWNIWYRKRHNPVFEQGDWKFAPPLLEELYNVEDALIAAQYLNAFIRRADVLKIACIAQVVNVIAPVMTRRDGMFLQTIFYPFELLSQHARGNSLQLVGSVPTYAAGRHGEAPVLDTAASFDAGTGRLMLSVVNRSLDQTQQVSLRVLDRLPTQVLVAQQLGGRDLQLGNTFEQPHAVTPQPAQAGVVQGVAHVTVPPTTHVVTVFDTAPR